MPHRQLNVNLLQQNLEIIKKMYDAVRVINPNNKHVMCFDNGQLTDSNTRCYDFWDKGGNCSNCITMKAYTDHKTYFKLENNNNRIYMITAIPIANDGDFVVLELIKDVTDQMVVEGTGETDNGILEILSKINQLQTRDSLTGLLNRGYIDERLPVELESSNRENKPLSIILLDIDRFKNVNDNYGHVAGDHALKELAGILAAAMEGTNNWAARYGGEEFLIVLPNTDKQAAADLAEQLRVKIEQAELEYEGKIIKITASMGVNTYNSPDTIEIESFIDKADKNLYRAKNNGRNRVEA